MSPGCRSFKEEPRRRRPFGRSEKACWRYDGECGEWYPAFGEADGGGDGYAPRCISTEALRLTLAGDCGGVPRLLRYGLFGLVFVSLLEVLRTDAAFGLIVLVGPLAASGRKEEPGPVSSDGSGIWRGSRRYSAACMTLSAISRMLEECGTNPVLRVGLHRKGAARWCSGRVQTGGVSR